METLPKQKRALVQQVMFKSKLVVQTERPPPPPPQHSLKIDLYAHAYWTGSSKQNPKHKFAVTKASRASDHNMENWLHCTRVQQHPRIVVRKFCKRAFVGVVNQVTLQSKLLKMLRSKFSVDNSQTEMCTLPASDIEKSIALTNNPPPNHVRNWVFWRLPLDRQASKKMHWSQTLHRFW